MLSVRSLLAHWPGLSAAVRRVILDVDAGDPYALAVLADLLAESTDLDIEDACALVGVDQRAGRCWHADSARADSPIGVSGRSPQES